jgi:N-acetyl-gamma-glutamyl-phosphate reductase common form
MKPSWPVIVLGGSGYVAGEMLRLIAAHPNLRLGAAVSTSLADQAVAATFGHLRSVFPDQRFMPFEAVVAELHREEHWIVLSAAPHGASAQIVGQLLREAETHDCTLTVVDASADFRFRDASSYAEVYGHAHATPDLLRNFTCAVPEHRADITTPHAAHPGCFATAMLLGIVPLLAGDLCGPDIYVSAVTGSTGAGRTPRDTTHHPVRQSNLFAYQALEHRHSPEVVALVQEATARDLSLHFVPHSGPFARGIHATIFAPMKQPISKARIDEAFADYYRDSTFVIIADTPPRMKDIAASNYAVLSTSVDSETIVVCAVLDNLVKGAAGGSVQWVNRLLELPEETGLVQPAAGWL